MFRFNTSALHSRPKSTPEFRYSLDEFDSSARDDYTRPFSLYSDSTGQDNKEILGLFNCEVYATKYEPGSMIFIDIFKESNKTLTNLNKFCIYQILNDVDNGIMFAKTINDKFVG